MGLKRRFRMTDSIFVRVILFMAFAMAAIAGLLTVQSFRIAETAGSTALSELGEELTGLLANQAGGAVQFRKTEDLESLLLESFERLNGKVAGGFIVSADGTVLAGDTGEIADISRLEAIGRSVLETGEPQDLREAFIFASPIVFGASETTVGALVVQWSAGALNEAIIGQKLQSLLAAGGVFALILAVMAYALRRIIAVPLIKIAGAMREVANGNYDAEVPKTRRGSEIGVVTTTLERFRDQLKESEAAARIAAFKGAGFAGSSAALMIVDANLAVVYTNPAFDTLINDGLGDQKLSDQIGTDGAMLPAFHADLASIARDLPALTTTRELDLEFGALTVNLSISPIDASDGERTGYVVEWEDVSVSRLNEAIMTSIDNNQARAEFDSSGRLLTANPAFLALAGWDSSGEAPSLTTFVTLESDTAVVDGTTPVFGDFRIGSDVEAAGYLHGGLSPIHNRAGTLVRSVLIGADVSAARAEKRAAERERALLVEAQTEMIDALRGGLARLSDGDLTVSIDTAFSGDNDRLRSDFNDAVQKLHDAIAAVAGRAVSIRGEVTEISGAADDLSRRTEHQAATLEETAAALTEITSSVSSAAEGARRANEVVSEARTNAEESGGVVRDAVAAMGEIADSSKKISSIISVIDDIAFQTNLLALNAGVEAARAGEAGRGFAVVASEVRALAQRSSDAAREINTLISASGDHVTRGVTLVGDAGTALERIVQSVGNISDHVGDIAASAQEQSSGLAEINTAVSQLDQVTQQNAAMFEETTAASQTLSNAAQDLSAAVARFMVTPSTADSDAEPSLMKARPETGSLDGGGFPQAQRATGTRGPQGMLPSEADLDDDWKDF